MTYNGDIAEFSDERAIAAKTFKDNYLTTKVKWPNIDWVEPKGDLNWVAWHIYPGPGSAIGLAELMLHRYSGVVIVQVFQKEKTGTDEARKIANTIAGIYRLKEICEGESGLLRFRTPFITEIGPHEGWYQINVSCPYLRDAYHRRPN